MIWKDEDTLHIFYSYSAQDEHLRQELEKHLSTLKHQKLITTWHSHKIIAGSEREQETNNHLITADIILLLVSVDFMASDYCYSQQMQLALTRHSLQQTRIIPIILRPTDWQNTPLSKLQVLPKDGRPVTSSHGSYGRDKVFLEIALGIRDAIEEMKVHRRDPQEQAFTTVHEKGLFQRRTGKERIPI